MNVILINTIADKTTGVMAASAIMAALLRSEPMVRTSTSGCPCTRS